MTPKARQWKGWAVMAGPGEVMRRYHEGRFFLCVFTTKREAYAWKRAEGEYGYKVVPIRGPK